MAGNGAWSDRAGGRSAAASEERLVQRLQAACGEGGTTAESCRNYLAGLDPLHRTELCTSLLFERLERKMRTLEALRADAGGDWNETFYLLYFRTLADRENKAAYLDLAHRLPCQLPIFRTDYK